MNSFDWKDSEYYSVATITLGELRDAGVVDWDSDEWHWDAYDEEQYTRVCKKIDDRFWFRDIALVPVAMWRREFMRKINEIMPKYKMLYARVAEGLDIVGVGGDYGKERRIYSEFPETLLSGNSDYASRGDDYEFEHVETGDVVDAIDRFYRRYRDIDVMILDDLEPMFSCLLAVNVNGL